MRHFLAAATFTLISSAAVAEERKAVEAKNGMVVAVCPIATQVGVDVLKSGGNAVEAAIAVAFAEAVTWPEAGNIGGGGFMMIWPGNGIEPVCIDYRETAPAAAKRDMFADGKDYSKSILSVGVPGTVRGLWLAHKRFSLAHTRFAKSTWSELVQPAFKLARDGFTVDAALAKRLNDVLADKTTTNEEFRRVYGKPDGLWQSGDTLKLPDLARTLAAIAENGDVGFYNGAHTDLVEAEMAAQGGQILKSDLAKYQAKERKPVRGTYRGHEIFGVPPPTSGGTTLILELNMLEQFDVRKNPRQSAETIHLLAEVQRRAFLERARYLGDPDFNTFNLSLTDKSLAKRLAATIDLDKATKSDTLAPELNVVEGDSTTHFSIIDKDGMAVSNTYTLENSFGCRIVVRGAGYILNNQMTDFNPMPGVTTKTGKIGTEPNQIAPGKRMLSSMSPTFIAKDGKLLAITGSPGGRTIINTVLCVTVNLIDYKMEVQAAVDEPRQHHQWFPDRIQLEQVKSRPDLVEKLQAKGHVVKHLDHQGDAHTIWIDPKSGKYFGAADVRLNGKAIGW